MKSQNLFFNLFTFSFPKKPVTFYFSKTPYVGSTPIHKFLFPNEIESVFPNMDQDTLYTSFCIESQEAKPLEVDFNSNNPNLIKRYYNHLIKEHFTHADPQLCRTNFINENQLWIADIQQQSDKETYYYKFILSGIADLQSWKIGWRS